jgi:hypothetical protein
MGENEGQPMYACPVDLRKMLWTAGGGSAGGDSAAAIDAAARTHYEAVAAFACALSRAHVRQWAALGAWAMVQAGKLAQVE